MMYRIEHGVEALGSMLPLRTLIHKLETDLVNTILQPIFAFGVQILVNALKTE